MPRLHAQGSTLATLATLAALCVLAVAPAAHAQTVDDESGRYGCSTAGVERLSEQLVRTQLCMRPDLFVTAAPHAGVVIVGTRVNALMSRTARAAMWSAASHRTLDIASMFRTVAQQYELYHSGACVAAASPGTSNHQSGRAIDVSNHDDPAVRSALAAAGCHWLGSFDPPHFDCPGPDYRADAIRAFQRLWNVNHPTDRIAEDGVYGPATNARLARSPAGGFAHDGCIADADGDGIADAHDDCPHVANSTQTDTDGDGIGNACDDCPTVANHTQIDTDHDGHGDACDTDDDGDGVPDTTDNCPLVPNPGQADTDHDGHGDACDGDDDGDGIPDTRDDCPHVADPDQSDLDGDGFGDACDPDDDGDGIPDATDDCPDIADPLQRDSDGDGLGDACDGTPLPMPEVDAGLTPDPGMPMPAPDAGPITHDASLLTAPDAGAPRSYPLTSGCSTTGAASHLPPWPLLLLALPFLRRRKIT